MRLLKIDTDGYDWDVLNSSKLIIQESKPMIYFEIFTENFAAYVNYRDTIFSLQYLGYEEFFIFDNFGGFIARCKFDFLDSLMQYVLKQNAGIFNRTIHYFDVLTCQKEDFLLVEKVLKKY